MFDSRAVGLAGRAAEFELRELRELAGKVAPVVLAGEQILPVGPAVSSLLPARALRRGSVVAVDGPPGTGATSVALHLAAGASKEGSWIAVVGVPALGLVAAEEAGIDLGRLAVVPAPGGQWPLVAAALLDAIDVVILRPSTRPRAQDVRRLASRARDRGGVLIALGGWPEGADVRLTSTRSRWEGLGQGHGCLQRRSVDIATAGRGAAARERRVAVEL